MERMFDCTYRKGQEAPRKDEAEWEGLEEKQMIKLETHSHEEK